MDSFGMSSILFFASSILIALFAIGLILSRLYKRSSKELSFVRTGWRGQKVIMNGGAIVLPVVHDTIVVNMNTLRLEVRRANEQALITRDRMRVDVQAEFYVRVKPTAEAIADAAQTLGKKTTNPNELKNLVEGKFVDALRSVAAEMAMEELHEQRVNFVQKVQQAVTEDLAKNGLELETVSLTGLDQTSPEYFNPQNAFDAQGLAKLTQEIEARRKERNDIEQDTAVQVQTKNLEAERKKLTLQQEEEFARLEQEREVKVRQATQAAEVARQQAERQQEAEQAKIEAQQQVDMSRIQAERAVAERKIDMEREVKEREVAKIKAVELAEIERQKVLELGRQDQAIAVAEKSRAQSEAEAVANQARAEAVQSEENVVTVRERERAERDKIIELVEAAKKAEQEAIHVTVAAEAEKKASEDQADAKRILAKGEADADKLRSEAEEVRYAVEAAGKRALHEADNVLSSEQIALQIKMAIVKYLPEIIRESVKPMERIEGIRIYQVDGLTGGASAGGTNGTGGATKGGNLADDVVSSALRYRAQAPFVDSLLQELGLSGQTLDSLTKPLLEEGPVANGHDAAAEKNGPEKLME